MSDLESVPIGYVVVPHPNTATFRIIGRNHIVSFIPETYFSNPIDNTTFCVWLGTLNEPTEILMYLIWLGKGLLNFAQACVLSNKNSSRVIKLIEQTGQFTIDLPTKVAEDLLLFNTLPCLLFIRWGDEANALLNEAFSISISTRVVEIIASLKGYLESIGVEGDAVSFSKMVDWYNAIGSELKKANRKDYIFDLTIIVVGVMEHLVTSLNENNQLDVTMKSILIPLCFIHRWASGLAEAIEKDPSLIKCYASIVTS